VGGLTFRNQLINIFCEIQRHGVQMYSGEITEVSCPTSAEYSTCKKVKASEYCIYKSVKATSAQCSIYIYIYMTVKASEYSTYKTVKARLWPWIQPFSRQRPLKYFKVFPFH